MCGIDRSDCGCDLAAVRKRSHEDAFEIELLSLEVVVAVLVVVSLAVAVTLVRAIMLKRRASKRFVLAESGEETAWNTTEDKMAQQQQQQPIPMPVINLETAVPSGSTSASSSFSEDNGGAALMAGAVDGLKVPMHTNLQLTVSGGLKLVFGSMAFKLVSSTVCGTELPYKSGLKDS